ncbi:MAG: alanine--tRNA ligase [Methanomassiliicoccales archaeon]|nr:alanine--tRNA ligase [Methanomassiliicoccales archaeon]
MNPSEFDLTFFKDGSFIRRQCPKCGRFFWTLGDWETCGEPPCEEYTFIGNSPMRKSLDLHQTRETFLSFFEEHGHGRVARYPIVARWRDDVFFTQASIYDFQPWVINGVVDPPANPLVISQTCVRFNDIDNVGKTGRHLTFFEMLAHHAFNKEGHEVYFKDRTVELCHELFTDRMGADPKRMRYIEAWWEGGGNSGPCLEVILDGVELATLVFMQYRDTPEGRVPLSMKVVDTGYGLERISWVSQGSSSAYEAVFGEVLDFLKGQVDVDQDERVLVEYSKVAGMTNAKTASDVRMIREETAKRMSISYDDLMTIVRPLEEMYVICDHTRALAFLLNDGVVPSNVREGYFARLLVRRALRSMRTLDLDRQLSEIVGRQVDFFVEHFPELDENREDILKLVDVEEDRYRETLSRGKQLVSKITRGMKKGEKIRGEKLIELYDSHGLNPEIVQEFTSVEVEVPDDFYIQVAERHEAPEEQVNGSMKMFADLPDTEQIYYSDPTLHEFEAEVIFITDGGVILDRTAFYPEGGGQEWDLGTLAGRRVTKVIKVGNSILHYLDGDLPQIGDRVLGIIDVERRRQLMRHHTAAHIINGVARRMLGNHVWQAGAHKSVEEARLDITHYENLDNEQREAMEMEANRIVLDDHPIMVEFMPRDAAERRYGHRLYQGGAVPGKVIRVVDIPGIDAEACGGIHCKRTSLVGPIRIKRTRRIQDGVVRIEYSAGYAAIDEMRMDRNVVEDISDLMNFPREKLVKGAKTLLGDNKNLRKTVEKMLSERTEIIAEMLLERSAPIGEVRLVTYLDEEGADIAAISKKLSSEKGLIVVAMQMGTGKVLVSRSLDLDLDSRLVLREINKLVGGGGGGKPDFAQGGGADPGSMQEAMAKIEEIIRDMMKS